MLFVYFFLEEFLTLLINFKEFFILDMNPVSVVLGLSFIYLNVMKLRNGNLDLQSRA